MARWVENNNKNSEKGNILQNLQNFIRTLKCRGEWYGLALGTTWRNKCLGGTRGNAGGCKRTPNLEESSWGAGKLKLTGRWNPLTKTVNVTLKSLRLSLVDICPVHVLKQGYDMINGLCEDELGWLSQDPLWTRKML